METGHPSTRAVNSGSGNRTLRSDDKHNDLFIGSQGSSRTRTTTTTVTYSGGSGDEPQQNDECKMNSGGERNERSAERRY